MGLSEEELGRDGGTKELGGTGYRAGSVSVGGGGRNFSVFSLGAEAPTMHT